MRIALAQINTTVGDIQGNLERARRAIGIGRLHGADVTLLPELTLTGYPPEDLVCNTCFVKDNLSALNEIALECEGDVVIGFVDQHHDRCFNAAAVLGGRSVKKVYHKRCLSDHDVFDERRYFACGSADEGGIQAREARSAGAKNISCCVAIGEDIRADRVAAEAAESGARVLLGIAASPFCEGQGSEREAMLVRQARDNGLWIACCNLIGGQDETVFDGRSVLISPEGEVVARAASFAEEVLVVDIDLESGAASRVASYAVAPCVVGSVGQGRTAAVQAAGLAVARQPAGSRAIEQPIREPTEETYRAIMLGISDYVRKNGFSDVVLGLSGGVDSALVATLAVDALGPGHVHGVLMPSRHSSAGSIDDALELAANLGIDTRRMPIESIHQAFLDALEPAFVGYAPGVAEENIQARVRGVLLMGLSNKLGWLVLTTGNKSELLVGYATLYGDMAGGFAPIKDVFKTCVYELCRWRNTQEGGPVIPEATLEKPPSAELRSGQTDQDLLPPYDVLDAILERYVDLAESCAAILEAGMKAAGDVATAGAVAGGDAATVDRVIEMVDGAEYKRRQAPLGVRLTARASGRGRRMPATNRYQK
ncbi:MAG: NAD+ synthase [Coriobacteriia bacterium]|nr:NAD+ synthase [Coriobacteriia bacterium]